MPDQKPGPFEEKVARLEAIAKELENGNVQIERAVSRRLEWKGAVYYFCSDRCERKFLSHNQQ